MGAAQTDGVFAFGESVEKRLADFKAFVDYSVNKNVASVDNLTSSCRDFSEFSEKRGASEGEFNESGDFISLS